MSQEQPENKPQCENDCYFSPIEPDPPSYDADEKPPLYYIDREDGTRLHVLPYSDSDIGDKDVGVDGSEYDTEEDFDVLVDAEEEQVQLLAAWEEAKKRKKVLLSLGEGVIFLIKFFSLPLLALIVAVYDRRDFISTALK
jgi:hypothetical protein